MRAEKARQRAARQMGRAENDHAGENNGSDEDRQRLGKEEDKSTPLGSDGEESDLDFEDLVRLYGTATFQARGLSCQTPANITSCSCLICAQTCSILIIAGTMRCAPCDAQQGHCLRFIGDGQHQVEMLMRTMRKKRVDKSIPKGSITWSWHSF